uniref:Beta-lactamase and RNA-metabolising metallo-beta-lactamase domain containing protein n=1 Tax=Haemonchus contortus TaxID=6289 RepID=A0A7I4YP52_HAECO
MDEDGGASSDIMCFTPLGSGQEVGRSCHLLHFKGKKILLDCGVHPGMHGVDALPFVDFIDIEEIDLLLITHFHLDHCGALPWLLEKTGFQGKCFMTHATKAIYRMLLGDYIKVAKYGGGSDRSMLYTDEDLERSMEKIEVIDFHEQKEVNGIRFWPYVAGHVLGACMFMIEIAGVRALYTGDFSRLEDRHLCAAELPTITPDVLISESTYGTQIHEERIEREKRFTQMVHDIVGRGGRCLIPAFALGRAQELLLILDEYWDAHPELYDIPVYYASSLAKKCMAVYQTFVSGMNQRIQKQIAVSNPFVFKHVSNLKGMEHFEDSGPCVVLASPGMLQNGLSRELFEKWCTDAKNGCIIAGYCVEGTLAKHILSEPEEIVAMNGDRLPMRLQVGYISFSAHTDFQQTLAFVKQLKPPHMILVHGEMHEMSRLKAGILRSFEEENMSIEIHNPRNTDTVRLQFQGVRKAKVVGALAIKSNKIGDIVSGILIKRNFNYQVVDPKELTVFTDLSSSRLSQRQSVYYSGSLSLLLYSLNQLNDDAILTAELKPTDTTTPTHVFSVFDRAISLQWCSLASICVLDWESNPVNDMYADAVLAAILHAQTNPIPEKYLPKVESYPKIEDALLTAVKEVCGDEAVTRDPSDRAAIRVEVDEKVAVISAGGAQVDCDDPLLRHLLSTISGKLQRCIAPEKPTGLNAMEVDEK